MDNKPINPSDNVSKKVGVTVNSKHCWNQYIDQLSVAATH